MAHGTLTWAPFVPVVLVSFVWLWFLVNPGAEASVFVSLHNRILNIRRRRGRIVDVFIHVFTPADHHPVQTPRSAEEKTLLPQTVIVFRVLREQFSRSI